MKNLHKLSLLTLITVALVGCGTEAGDPMKGANTGDQPSSVGNLPAPANKTNTAPTPPGNSFGRS